LNRSLSTVFSSMKSLSEMSLNTDGCINLNHDTSFTITALASP
jgi:hypothetical protein